MIRTIIPAEMQKHLSQDTSTRLYTSIRAALLHISNELPQYLSSANGVDAQLPPGVYSPFVVNTRKKDMADASHTPVESDNDYDIVGIAVMMDPNSTTTVLEIEEIIKQWAHTVAIPSTRGTRFVAYSDAEVFSNLTIDGRVHDKVAVWELAVSTNLIYNHRRNIPNWPNFKEEVDFSTNQLRDALSPHQLYIF